MIKQNTFLNQPHKVSVIGVPVSVVTMESALRFVDENHGTLRGEYICAANVHTTVMARDDSTYKKVQNESAMALPDGKPLSVIGKRKTANPMEKVTGTHFMQQIFQDPRFKNMRHYFYGTDADTLNTMIAKISLDYPELTICGWEPSVFRELSDDEIDALALRMNKSRPDFIWVALGAPRQEFLMNQLRGKVSGLMTGVGGAFKILAGIISDAPTWMQNAGLEWLYRLLCEPRRLFKRYLVTNAKFIYFLLSGK